ncbi:hypothetical protein [Bacillus xiapuensis]|uniref:hypothetical protein n=1 Tax=Bacillus xiapuensis TaxID=2014075 RepID=UPI0012FD5D49|nr:hypothetical protein [Bacillus xiapuensis]
MNKRIDKQLLPPKQTVSSACFIEYWLSANPPRQLPISNPFYHKLSFLLMFLQLSM